MGTLFVILQARVTIEEQPVSPLATLSFKITAIVSMMSLRYACAKTQAITQEIENKEELLLPPAAIECRQFNKHMPRITAKGP